MSRREKTEFILEQVALCIQNGDWTQASILSRKISTRYFSRKPKKSPEQLEKERKEREEKAKKKAQKEAGDADQEQEKEDDVTDLKLRYYEQQIMLAKHEDRYLDACKHYRQVLDTEAVEQNPEQLKAVILLSYLAHTTHVSHEDAQLMITHRFYKELYTTSSWHHTTTNNPTSSNASSETTESPRSVQMLNS